jgi:hypothetical protein
VIEPDDYAWLEDDESYLADGFALVLVESEADHTDVISRAGLTAREVPLGTGVWDVDPADGEVTRLGRLGRWLTFLAPNGHLLAAAAGPASQAGRVVAFYESINADMEFGVAVNGKMVRSFDPLLDEPGEGYGEPLPEEDGLPFGGVDDPVVAAAFALMERITGTPITQEWLMAEDRPMIVVSE